ncbi:helix-turn-helix transcriptional regulator [Streptomyces sp. NPDC019224]|uniref:helix-turn-helix domain-containing protein n=1 Tax=Streptomyces sp. NPDC019224 TaxID=3154484 RepID=UPI0033DB4263
MEQNKVWSPTATVAERVREAREQRRLTAQQLADRLAAQGIAWQRSTVAKLENGNRENVSLTEWLALAAALNVAPVHLLVPIDVADDAAYQVTPETTVPVVVAREWIRGSRQLPGERRREFTAQAPEGEWVSFDTTTPDGQRAAIEWLKRSELGTITTRGDSGEHR